MTEWKVTKIPPVNPDSLRSFTRYAAKHHATPPPPKVVGPKTERHAGGCVTLAGKPLDEYAEYKNMAAHRWAYCYVHNCTLKSSEHVHHKCGNKGCINPEHLAVQTSRTHPISHAMGRKYRGKWIIPVEELHPEIEGE